MALLKHSGWPIPSASPHFSNTSLTWVAAVAGAPRRVDTRDDGRGWYHLQPETLGMPDDVLHWTGSGQTGITCVLIATPLP